MNTNGDVLSPLPYQDAPTSKTAIEDLATRSLDDDSSIAPRELSPDLPPLRDDEGGTLMGSPLHRATFPSPTAERGLEADTSRPSAIPTEEGGTKDIPDVLVIQPVAPVEPKTTPIDAATGQKISEVVTKKELATLKQAVTDLYQRVSTELAPNSAKAALALGWLSEARTIGLGRPEQYPIAELRVAQTRTLLEQFRQSRDAVAHHARGLVIANIVWLVLFGALFFVDQWLRAGGIAGLNLKAISLVFPPWLCVLAGGLGGALAALVALGRVISRREFNPDDNLDYYLNGLKGALLGGVAYYLILGGFVTAAATSGVNFAPSMEGGSLLDSMQAGATESPLFIVIAFIAGLAQQRLLSLLGRVWNDRTGTSDPTPAATPATTNADLASVPVPTTDVPVAISNDGVHSDNNPAPEAGGAG
jgi:hypothetical protein